jgi:hypothetical protein
MLTKGDNDCSRDIQGELLGLFESMKPTAKYQTNPNSQSPMPIQTLQISGMP